MVHGRTKSNEPADTENPIHLQATIRFHSNIQMRQLLCKMTLKCIQQNLYIRINYKKGHSASSHCCIEK